MNQAKISAGIVLHTMLTRIFTIIGAMTVLAVIGAGVGMFYVAHWLCAADTPARVDTIVVLSGAPERTMYAADLFHQRLATSIYVGRPVREKGHRTLEEFGVVYPAEEQVNRAILMQRGVPEAAIRMYGRASVNTLDEARSAQSALPPTVHSIMIVTSPYHVKRARTIFTDVFSGSGIPVMIVADPYENYPDHWWTDQEAARQTVSELVKLAFYWLNGDFSKDQSKDGRVVSSQIR